MVIKMSYGVCILFALMLCVPFSGHSSKVEKSPLPIRVAVVDNCLLTSTSSVQMANYAQGAEGTANSDFSVLCGLDKPYMLSLEDETGGLLTTLVEADDGFGYQYHVEKDKDGGHVVEVCETLADVPIPPEGSSGSTLVPEQGHTLAGSGGQVTINISW